MNYPYGSRGERDDRERRALRDSRDQRHGDQHEDRFAGGRQSYSRDNEYQFDQNRGRGYGSGDFAGGRSNDDLYGRSGQSDWSSRSYPRQQGSFERAGYDSDREFWEGSQSGQYGSQGRFASQRPEYQSGRFGGSSSGGSGFRSGQQGQQDFSQPSGGHYNYSEHGGHQSGQQHYGGSPDNYWQHGGRFGAGGGFQGGGGDQGGGYQGGGYQRDEQSFGGHRGYESGGYMGTAGRNRPPKGYTRSDERVREDICERLMQSPFIDAGEVSVEVKDGKVSLEGSVPDRSMKHRIEDIAEQCIGVKDVDNRIRVSRDQGEHGSWGGSQSGVSGSTAAAGSSGSHHAVTGKAK